MRDKCGVSFRATDGLPHICDIEKGVGHEGLHYCEAHNVYAQEDGKTQSDSE